MDYKFNSDISESTYPVKPKKSRNEYLYTVTLNNKNWQGYVWIIEYQDFDQNGQLTNRELSLTFRAKYLKNKKYDFIQSGDVWYSIDGKNTIEEAVVISKKHLQKHMADLDKKADNADIYYANLEKKNLEDKERRKALIKLSKKDIIQAVIEFYKKDPSRITRAYFSEGDKGFKDMNNYIQSLNLLDPDKWEYVEKDKEDNYVSHRVILKSNEEPYGLGDQVKWFVQTDLSCKEVLRVEFDG